MTAGCMRDTRKLVSPVRTAVSNASKKTCGSSVGDGVDEAGSVLFGAGVLDDDAPLDAAFVDADEPQPNARPSAPRTTIAPPTANSHTRTRRNTSSNGHPPSSSVSLRLRVLPGGCRHRCG